MCPEVDRIDTVLVTGSSGTIGTALMKRLLEEGYNIYGVDLEENPWIPQLNEHTFHLDLTDPTVRTTLPTDIDAIVHLAAHARVHKLVQNPSLAEENVRMTFNILEHARRAGIPRVIFASSREVYGNQPNVVCKEGDAGISHTESPYTASKVAGEALIQSYERCYEVSPAIARFSNVYGRYDRSDRVIPKFIEWSAQGKPLTVYGRGKVLDFTFIDDCVNGILLMLRNYQNIIGQTVNISSGEGTSLIELARKVNDITPRQSEISIEQSRAGEVKKFVGNISKAKYLLDYSPSYSLQKGLTESVDWYMRESQISV